MQKNYSGKSDETPRESDDGGLNDFNNEGSQYKSLVSQIRQEYELSYKAQASRLQVNLRRLKLYNNQRRDPEAVGDPLLFTIFQSILAILYSDTLSARFVGRNEGNEDKAENINNTAKFDYDEMDKNKSDYELIWDTLFYGSGIRMITYFDRKKMCPVPEVWDSMTTLHDPEAVSLNGDMTGKEAARWFGREIMITKHEMEDIPSVFDLDMLKNARPTRSLISQAQQAREDAAGVNNQIRFDEKDLGENARFPVVEWLTHWKHPVLTDGKVRKVLVWLGNDLTKVCRFKVLDKDKWPGEHRKLFPTAHQWEGVSIPDIVEDKQRMRAVILNLAITNAKAEVFGMYLFDKNKIKTKADLNFDVNKAIPVDPGVSGNITDAVYPMPKSTMNANVVNYILNMLETSAEQAMSMPTFQQGQVSKKDKTLGELNKVDQGSTGRHGLSVKIFGWAEKDFWYVWYFTYQKHFHARFDEKTIRINTVFGPKYKPLLRSDIILDGIDPDVYIESELLTEQQKMAKRQLFLQYAQLSMGAQGVNVRYMMRRIGKLSNIPTDEMDRLLPKSSDEIKAEYENVLLNDNKFVPVDPKDNNEEHLEKHAEARQTVATLAHIATHQHAQMMQKQNPELFPQLQQQQAQQQQSQQNVQGQLQKATKKKPQAQAGAGEGTGQTTALSPMAQ